MTRSTFRFVSLLAFNFSAVLCAPQISSRASDDIQNGQDSSTSIDGIYNVASSSTPGNSVFVPGTRDPNYIDTAALQGNAPGTMNPTDITLVGSGLVNFESMPSTDGTLVGARLSGHDNPSGEASRIDNPDTSDQKMPAVNTLLSQISPARDVGKYHNSDCDDGTSWACCSYKKVRKAKDALKIVCNWIWQSDVQKCDVIECCAAAGGVPDQYCPNRSPVKDLVDLWNEFTGNLEPVFGNSGGGGSGSGIGGLGAGAAWEP